LLLPVVLVVEEPLVAVVVLVVLEQPQVFLYQQDQNLLLQ
jgi:hypothetical protein